MTYADSFIGKAIRIDSHNEYVGCETEGININEWQGFTFSAMVKLEQYTTYNYVVHRGMPDGSGTTSYGLQLGGPYGGNDWGAKGYFAVRTNELSSTAYVYPPSLEIDAAYRLNLNQWYHMVGTYDGINVSFYLDGALDITRAYGPEAQPCWDDNSARLAIGKMLGSRVDWTDSYLHGLIDEVRIYNRGLSQAEVTALNLDLNTPRWTLDILGSPDEYGAPQALGYGSHLVAEGSVVTNSVVSPAEESEGTRRACTGWTGTGDVPANGSATTVSFTLTEDSALTWQWITEYELNTEAGEIGSVNVGDGWYTNGAEVAITATPSNGYEFAGWEGDVPDGSETNNPLTLTMDQPRDVTAAFTIVTSPDEDLIVHYTCDDAGDTAFDQSGNGHDGAIQGTTLSTDRFGIPAACYYLDGDDDWIEMSSLADRQQLTFACWFKTGEGASTQALLGNDGSYLVLVQATEASIGRGKVRATSKPGGSCGSAWEPGTYSTSRVDNAEWHHVIWTRDDDGAEVLYLDGQLADEASEPGSIPVCAHKHYIGRSTTFAGATTYVYEGFVDDVRIYNRALSSEEATGLYDDLNSGVGGHMVLHYTFDDDDGTNVWDSSGNGNDGFLVGGVTYADSMSGQAVRINSSSEYVGCDSAGVNASGWHGITLSVWVKLEDYTTYGGVINRGNLTGEHGWSYGTHLGGPYPPGSGNWGQKGVFFARTNATTSASVLPPSLETSGSTRLDLDTWYHFAGTYDGTNVAFYINGVLDTNKVVEPTGMTCWDDPDYRLSIGKCLAHRIDWTDAYHHGLIDEVKIYNRGLSSNEVVALWEELPHTTLSLEIDGSPAQYGEPQDLGYGTHHLDEGSVVTNSVVSPTEPVEGTRRACTGWVGTGSVPADGDTTTVTFEITENSALTWQWIAEYELDTEAGEGGSVNVGDGWYTNGSEIVITATASNDYEFAGWEGDIPDGNETNNPLTITMDQARDVTALFELETTDLDAGLVAYYPFNTEGTLGHDASGNEHHGTVYNATWTGTGAAGGGCYFDGSGDYINLGSETKQTGPFTVSIWYTYETTGEANSLYGGGGLDAGVDRNGIAISRSLSTGHLFLDIYDTPSRYGLPMETSQVDFTAEGWHHVLGSYDEQYMYLYVDGELAEEAPKEIGAVTIDWSAVSHYLGRRGEGGTPTWYWKGKMDEVRIYDRALSTNEVAALYAEMEVSLILVVDGDPEQYGEPGELGYGAHQLAPGTVVSNNVASPTEAVEGTRRTCTGWVGAGSVPSSGVVSMVSFEITEESTLTWQWITEYELDTEAGEGGSVSVGDGWYVSDSPVVIMAITSNGYEFLEWQGDVPEGSETNNPLVLTMDQARDVTAVFTTGTSPDEDLLVHYTCDDAGDTAFDQSGNGHDGAIQGATLAMDRSGVPDACYYFDGTEDPNHVFIRWDGDYPEGDRWDSTITVTMDQPRDLTAVFELDQYKKGTVLIISGPTTE